MSGDTYTTRRKRGGLSEIWSGGRLVGLVTMYNNPRGYMAQLVHPTVTLYTGPSKRVAESEVISADRKRQAARATLHSALQGSMEL